MLYYTQFNTINEFARIAQAITLLTGRGKAYCTGSAKMETITTLIFDNALISTIIITAISMFLGWLTFEKMSSETTSIVVAIAAILMICGFCAGGFCDIVFGEFAPNSVQTVNAIAFALGLGYLALSLAGIATIYIGGWAIMMIYICILRPIASPFVWLYKKSNPTSVA
jgi:hypothetical protein